MKNILIAFAFLLIQKGNAQSQFLDTTFGTDNGYTFCQMGSDDAIFTNMLEFNNAIFAVHSTFQGGYFVSKYSLNGILDTNFGTSGFTNLNNNTFSNTSQTTLKHIRKIKSTTDNKLLIINDASTIATGQTGDAIISKLNLDGTFDLNYGTNGQVFSNIATGFRIIGTHKFPQDELLLIAQTLTTATNPQTQIIIIKVNAAGNFDSTFGINGKLTLPSDFNGFSPQYTLFKNQSVYLSFQGMGVSSYIKKFDLSTSSYDLTFGVNGKLSNLVGLPYGFGPFTIDDSNNIFLAATIDPDNYFQGIIIFKFTNALLNPSFGTNGMASINVPAGYYPNIFSIDLIGNKLVLLGSEYLITPQLSVESTMLARVNLNGTIDTSFGQNGIIRNENAYYNFGLAVDYIYNNDYIITGGGRYDNIGQIRPCLTKYTPNNLSSYSTTKNNFSYYPNPVTNELHFQTNADVIKIAIYDILGRLIKSAVVSQNKTDLSELTSGAYIVKAQTTNETHTFKVIKK